MPNFPNQSTNHFFFTIFLKIQIPHKKNKKTSHIFPTSIPFWVQQILEATVQVSNVVSNKLAQAGAADNHPGVDRCWTTQKCEYVWTSSILSTSGWLDINYTNNTNHRITCVVTYDITRIYHVNYFTSSDPHHDISKQLVDTTFVWSFCLSGILSGILIWHSIWHSIWRSIWHSYLAFLSGILIWHSSLAFYLAFHLAFYSGILIWQSSLAFYLALYLTFYLAFYLAYLLAFSPAVEVRQGTLGVDSRGWGPAGNTGRGWSRLRSGREHLAWILAVEVRQGTLGVDSRGWGPEEAEGGGRRKSTDIKSNNPHLAGGEKSHHISLEKVWGWIHIQVNPGNITGPDPVHDAALGESLQTRMLRES